MNERIKELAEQANADADWSLDTDPRVNWYEVRDERFAKLVRQDEAKACAEHYVAIMRDAVTQARLAEREACAKLCEEYFTPNLGKEIAAAIRARKETT